MLNEALDAVCKQWPAERVGVRLTPANGFDWMSDSDPRGHPLGRVHPGRRRTEWGGPAAGTAARAGRWSPVGAGAVPLPAAKWRVTHFAW
ncbi:hypothetical protein M4D82_31970 [Streptomyces sp. RerS4]|nr:hypothetical protein M4D82_31970 [Streptomyces sp. RerS4]